MPASSPSLYRTFAWILLACLIGLYLLYDWYTDTLRQDLESRGAQAALSAQRLNEADTRLKRATETEKGLHDQLAGLEARLASETKALTGKISDAKAELEALAERHRQATEQAAANAAAVEEQKKALTEAADREQGLNAKLDAAAAAQAELETAHRAAKDRGAALEGELKRLNQTLASTEERAAEKARELEQRLMARIDHFRTALEGSEPERARVLSEMEREAEAHRVARDKAEEALETARAATEQAKAEGRSSLASARAAGQQALDAMRTEAQKVLAASKSEAERLLAETRSTLEAQLVEARKAAEEGAAALKVASETHAQEQSAAQAKIDSLLTELEGERGALSELQEKYDTSVAELHTELGLAEQSLTEAKDALSANVKSAAEKRKSLEDRIAALEQDLAQTRSQAEATHAADLQARQQAVAQARGLFARYSELGGKQTERGMLLSLTNDELRFASGAALIPKGEHPGLDRIATLMKDQPKLTARIEGHTDNAGPEEINLKLSAARAEAVKQALIDLGVPADRLSAQGMGESNPIADNGSASGRRQNRRVEVYVIEEVQ